MERGEGERLLRVRAVERRGRAPPLLAVPPRDDGSDDSTPPVPAALEASETDALDAADAFELSAAVERRSRACARLSRWCGGSAVSRRVSRRPRMPWRPGPVEVELSDSESSPSVVNSESVETACMSPASDHPITRSDEITGSYEII